MLKINRYSRAKMVVSGYNFTRGLRQFERYTTFLIFVKNKKKISKTLERGRKQYVTVLVHLLCLNVFSLYTH